MDDKFKFEMSYYFSSLNGEKLPSNINDYEFYLKYIEYYLMDYLCNDCDCLFTKEEIRKWVYTNTEKEKVYSRHHSECFGDIVSFPNIDDIICVGNRYADEIGKNFNPLTDVQIIHETNCFYHSKLGFKVCLFVNLRILEINNVAT